MYHVMNEIIDTVHVRMEAAKKLLFLGNRATECRQKKRENKFI